MYDAAKGRNYAVYNGRRILGDKTDSKDLLLEKYRLPCTGKDQGKSMAYNIEKYNYYSKYAILDNQGGLNVANTRMYSFTTELDEGEVAAQGELPNVDSDFTNYMGWGGKRNDVDLTGKVWITVGVTSREARTNTAKPLGTGNYNFSKIAVVDVVPNKDNLGLEPYYNEGSGKAEETVKLPVNLKNSKKFPEGTRFMLESDPKDKFETNHSTGAITQTPAKPNGPISINQYTGEVTVKIPKGAKGGEEIKDKVHVIYPDGSTHIVPLVVKVIEDKPNIKRDSFATNPLNNEKQLDKVPFDDIYMGDDVLTYTYEAGDKSKIIKKFTADGLPSGTTFGVGTKESSNNADDADHKRLERPLLLKADTKAKVGDFAITFKAVNGSGKETTATNPGVIKTYLPTNNGTKIRIKKGTPEANIPSPEAAIGIYQKKYKDRDDIRRELNTGINANLIKKDKTGYLPEGTTYTWERTPDTDAVEQSRLYYALVKYKDKNGKEVVDKVPVYVEVYDTDDVIAYTPKDVTKPTNEKDKNVPKKDSKKDDVDVNDYNIVAFRTEDKTKGTLTKDKEQNKEVISVLVKKNKSNLNTFGSIKPTVNTVNGYTFWFWDKDPANVKQVVKDKDTYANKDVYTAYFIKSGDEIKEVDKNIPLPNGFHKVTIAKGDGIEDNKLFGKTYAVKEGAKLSRDKFPNLKAQASYKEPKWNVGNPWDQVMGKADVTYTATAAQKTIAEKIEVLGGIEGKDLAVWVGDTLNADFWKKGVVAKSTDTINKAAVEATIQAAKKVEDVTKPARTTNAEVLNPTAGKLKITFADGSSLEVEQKLYVYAKKTTKPTAPKQPTPIDAVVVAYNKGDGVKELQGTGKTLVKSGETLADADFPRATLKEGHKDVTWSGQTAGNPKDYKVTESNKVFTATATKIEYTTDEVIPWIPKDPKNPENDKPTTGKDGKEIPANYITVTFKSEDATKGTVKVGTKTGAEVKAKVKPDTDLAKRTDITAEAKNGYGFTEWDPALGVAQKEKPYIAKFIKDGSEVG
ncbi:Rib/alpha-like domain-containing protein, partial [Peptoniphilus vaginalis]|uniref:Rib/alpha-like domain-containing protein n=1 Tax=Peptoniphilus vaginalis TaxID=1756987 RepID=UPI001073C1CD